MDFTLGNVSTEEGLRLLKAGQIDQAIDVLGKVLQADSEDAKAHMYIGIAYYQKNDRLHSIHHLEESLRLEETPKGYYNLGLVYEAVHRVDEAVRQYRMALEMDPNYELAKLALKRLHDKFEAGHSQTDDATS
jgi:tetratricopeptide (TPR) repeat protein